jgi:dienelactone hydrolase
MRLRPSAGWYDSRINRRRPHVRNAAAALIVVGLVGCGPDHSVQRRAVTFDGLQGFLVERPSTGHHAAVVLVHGSGGDRRELLPQAVALAKQGLVALTITEPSSAHPEPPATTLTGVLASVRREHRRDVAAVRAAARFLAGRGDVDAKRLGYLGWSAGAKTGTFVTDRFRALALLSAGAATVEDFAAAAPRAARARVRRALTPIDPIHAIARARAGSLLLEDGRRDAVVPRAALLNVARAAPPGTLVRWYDAGHALNDRAYADARSWLVRRLTK